MLARLMALAPRVSREDYWDADAGEWDLEGLASDLRIAREAPAGAGDAEDSKDDEGEVMIARLRKLDSRVSREDYWDEDAAEWDLEGLRSDLRIAEDGAGSAAGGDVDAGEAMFSELAKLDSAASKEDYFDGGEWDLDGLRDDLALARR
mmetsp:Transcript_52104/g.137655  ORF Transcript_52104/g.137655 Transcript_52104/m.137655 type:complete len:149 (-) Transcript_52104:40-486(-)